LRRYKKNGKKFLKKNFNKKFKKLSLKKETFEIDFSCLFIAYKVQMKKKTSHKLCEMPKKKEIDFQKFLFCGFQIYQDNDLDFQSFQLYWKSSFIYAQKMHGSS